MDQVVGSDFTKGLKAIKKITEEVYADQLKYKIEESVTEKIQAVTTHITCKQKEIGKRMSEGFGVIMETITNNKLTATGAPFAIYLSCDTTQGFEMDLGMPVKKCHKKLKGNMECKSYDAIKVIKTDYFGHYEGSAKAYKVMQDWVIKNKRTITGPPWEVYMTDPQQEKDSSKLHTVIMFPVK